MDDMQQKGELVEVPWRQLQPDTLAGVIESFILREGTNYGAEEVQFSTKIDQVKRQLEDGSVLLVFDTLEETCTLLTQHELKRVRSQTKISH